MKKSNCIIAFLVCLLLAFVMTLGSCSSQKQVSRSQTSVDSSVLKEQEEAIRILRIENTRLTAEVHELQYAGVTFDSSRCPPPVINVPANCNVDSILALLNDTRSKVKIYADGSIEAEGKLKSAYYSKDKLSRVITELQRVNDSLRLVKNKEVIKYVTNTVTVTKKKKSSFFTSPLIWIIIGFAGATLLWNWKKIFSYLRK